MNWIQNKICGIRAILLLLMCLVNGVAPLHAAPADDWVQAVKFDHEPTLKTLLAKGADPNVVDAQGDPLLLMALKEKSNTAVKLLLQSKRLDLNKTNLVGENALMLAALQGRLDVVKILVEEREAELNKTGWTALHYAASTGQRETVKYLLDHGAEIDALSPNGTTPLMMAVRGGYVDTVKLLLAEGADMALKNQQKMSALDFAISYQHEEIAAGLAARQLMIERQEAEERAAGKNKTAVAVPSAPAAAPTQSAQPPLSAPLPKGW